MHHPYKYIRHDIERLQKYLDFLFLHVWCKARGPFDSSKLDRYPELKAIYEKLEIDDKGKWAYYFISRVTLIYDEFLKIGKSQRKALRKYYRVNNQINSLCVSDKKTPMPYDELLKSYPKLTTILRDFYGRLYGSESPFILAAFGDFLTMKDAHYAAFIAANFNGHEGTCPFCGLNPIKGNDHTTLEAYDHFLPKGVYPFNSINFQNLALMCHECNSSYKLASDPLMNIDPLSKKSKVRRRAFYPYSNEKWTLDFKVGLKNPDFGTLKKEEIEITVSAKNKDEEIEGWKEVFAIEERYRAKILAVNSGRRWYEDLTDGILNARKLLGDNTLSKDKWLTLKLNECDACMLGDANFLKKAFLVECNNIGIN